MESIHVYYDVRAAHGHLIERERQIGLLDDEPQVCLFAARSLNALLVTHANWFDVDPGAAHERMLAHMPWSVSPKANR